ncbi:hypothetical protein KS4_01900 [Poriferisphaera corsica]|uniref:Uncharacterized protein n=1 Tax=Poriferisphaera corsica TaxID=2528020 RepID=A0A517YPL2_9BACT|nr:hypothetical protein KS4_01900 [Poriferisphaera corsica]
MEREKEGSGVGGSEGGSVPEQDGAMRGVIVYGKIVDMDIAGVLRERV